MNKIIYCFFLSSLAACFFYIHELQQRISLLESNYLAIKNTSTENMFLTNKENSKAQWLIEEQINEKTTFLNKKLSQLESQIIILMQDKKKRDDTLEGEQLVSLTQPSSGFIHPSIQDHYEQNNEDTPSIQTSYIESNILKAFNVPNSEIYLQDMNCRGSHCRLMLNSEHSENELLELSMNTLSGLIDVDYEFEFKQSEDNLEIYLQFSE
ncbi:MAG: hypothetical protein AAGB12_03400 [Pseudomonadota bacterium]